MFNNFTRPFLETITAATAVLEPSDLLASEVANLTEIRVGYAPFALYWSPVWGGSVPYRVLACDTGHYGGSMGDGRIWGRVDQQPRYSIKELPVNQLVKLAWR